MATHSSVLAWTIPGTGEPGGLPSMGSYRVGHEWSDLAAAAAAESWVTENLGIQKVIKALKFFKNYFGFVCFHGVENHLDTMNKESVCFGIWEGRSREGPRTPGRMNGPTGVLGEGPDSRGEEGEAGGALPYLEVCQSLMFREGSTCRLWISHSLFLKGFKGQRKEYLHLLCWLFQDNTDFNGFPGGSVVKNPPVNAGDMGSILGSGRSPGEGNGNPLQYSCLEKSMDRGVWQATVHGVASQLDLGTKQQ